jgi:hypothetical protein
VGELSAEDVDYYSIPVAAGAFVTGSTFDLTPVGGPALDTLLGVFHPSGALMGFNDDDGPGLLSAFAFVAPVSGVYTFAITGFGDADFNGSGHTELGPYRLVVSVPEPAGAVLLIGLAGVLLSAYPRRRN